MPRHGPVLLGSNSTTRTPATDMLYNTTNGHTTNGRAHNNSTTDLPHRMLGCGKFLSVGGEFVVQQVVELVVSVGGVRSRCSEPVSV